MTALVLLPGMDGTGALFECLIPHLTPGISVQVVTYPTTDRLGYEDLAQFVLRQLPPPPYVLLGESFSGPIAIRIAAERQPAALVLVCSFVRAPWSLRLAKPLIGLMPAPTRFMPVLRLVLMGKYGTPELRNTLTRSLLAVEPDVLRLRAAEALSADMRGHLERVACPVLYLQAAQDRLIPTSCAEEVLRIRPSAVIARLAGPHFLLQT